MARSMESRLYFAALPNSQKDSWQNKALALAPLMDAWRGGCGRFSMISQSSSPFHSDNARGALCVRKTNSPLVRGDGWRPLVRAGSSEDWVGAELSGLWERTVEKNADPPPKEAARQVFEALGAAPPPQSQNGQARILKPVEAYDPASRKSTPSLSRRTGTPENGQQNPTNASSSAPKAPPVLDTEAQWDRAFPTYLQSKSGGEGDICHTFDESEAAAGAGNRDGSANEMSISGAFRQGAGWAAAAAKAASQAAVEAIGLSKSQGSGSSTWQGLDSGLGSSVLAAPPSSAATSPSTAGKRMPELIHDDPIWAAIRAEARLEAEQEPLLSSFLYASILAHSCFERSLGFVLSNRLKNATLLSTQLVDVFDEVLMQENIRRAIRADVQAVHERDPSCRAYSHALLYYKGYHALQSYRIAHAVWRRGQRVLALALQSRISEVFSVDIHPAARIGCGILLDHGTGVVIGETAVIGNRVSLLQGVTLGGTGKEAFDRHPKIHEGVLIGVGATILGNITVGRGAMVAAGSLVLKPVPPHSMVAGTPAKVVGFLEEATPALTMKHDVTRTFCEEWDEAVRQQVSAEKLGEGAGI